MLTKDSMNREIILIGHSVGCYIILELLAQLGIIGIKNRVKHAFLLFPTIERMSETPNGKVLTFATTFFMWLIYFMGCLVASLPSFIQRPLIDIFYIKRHEPNKLVSNMDEVVLKMCSNYSCVRSCFHMGRNEMHYVKALKTSLITQNRDLLTLYYGTTDKWCPLSYYYDMRNYMDSLDNMNKKLG